ncbi:hypothetical protein ALC57_15443 [Trachymyrmex cornetzi]|uniref:Tyr recombinase domain-containing protein n=1 Tax=Trachymyrmex cornetzi TaxID=471704 RepID=A0A151IX32_9HYME|nr:hypothetical protein ALC57_15443 [Trachymyrmex cornetzi]
MIASLAPATIKQYTRPLKSWWEFCQRHQTAPFFPEVNKVLDFLSQEARNIGSYSSFNTTRSAISLISNNAIGNHPLVRRLSKGMSIIKPQRPRYEYIWDPAPVICKLATLFPYESLSLEVITRKLVLLLALGSGQRVQTLAAIKISQIFRENENKVIIKIPDRLKTSAPGRAQPLLTYSCFLDRPELCIINILDHYLQRTGDLRPPDCDTLLISYAKPHRAVGPQSVSRWIRRGLEDCGVRSDLFSAHSPRHASTSLAANKGVSLDFIKRAAGWSGDSQVFARFYNRTIINPDAFCSSVLST